MASIAQHPTPRQLPASSTSSKDVYADSDPERVSVEVQRLKDQFKEMTLQANVKVTTERVYCMTVHPEKTKTLVLVGDKQGMLGM